MSLLNNKEWSQSQSHFFKYGCLMALTKYVALCRCWMWYVEVEQEHQNGVIVLQSLTNAASVQYENLSLYVHIDIYFTVLPAICDENVWTFTRITRIYLISYFQWFSQVRLTYMRNPLSNQYGNKTWYTRNYKNSKPLVPWLRNTINSSRDSPTHELVLQTKYMCV